MVVINNSEDTTRIRNQSNWLYLQKSTGDIRDQTIRK